MDEIPEEDTGTPEVADVGGPASVEKAAANVASIADQTLLAVQQLGVGSIATQIFISAKLLGRTLSKYFHTFAPLTRGSGDFLYKIEGVRVSQHSFPPFFCI